MLDISLIMTVTIYIFTFLIAVFLIVHTSIQFENITIYLNSQTKKNQKNNNKKNMIIIIICIISCIIIYNQALNYINSPKKHTTAYRKVLAELNDTMILELSLKGKDAYKNSEELVQALIYRYPAKNIYYIKSADMETSEFSREQIRKFKLYDFMYNPTFIRYDGILISIIKFENNCRYVNTEYLGQSDCIIEVDANNFKKPNTIGKDRILFAIDGKNNTIKADVNFFK